MNPTDLFTFAIIMTLVASTVWVVTTLIRNHHAYRMARIAADTPAEADRTIHVLTNENDRLTGQVSRLEERIAVLERIATDPALRTHHAIEALR